MDVPIEERDDGRFPSPGTADSTFGLVDWEISFGKR
jgi:hypothetical protein